MSDMGFATDASGHGGVQHDIILVNESWYVANRRSIYRIVALTRLIDLTALRMMETR